MRFCLRLVLPCLLVALPGVLRNAAAQPAPNGVAWESAETLPGVDFSGLKPEQVRTALELLRHQDCSCACGMKVAECRVKDPNCSYSTNMAKIAVDGVKAGKSREEISKALSAVPGVKRPKLLEDPISIATAGSPSRGPAAAKITLVEFSDFECPYCSLAESHVREVMGAYPAEMRLIYKQFPLPMHPHAELAAEASLAALEQGKYWELHDKLFANFRRLNRENILLWAREVGLNMEWFTASLDSGKYKAVVQRDVSDGEAAGVYGTPSFFINGKRYNGPFELGAVKPILDAELKITP
jgi:protein-disulfide isomerase